MSKKKKIDLEKAVKRMGSSNLPTLDIGKTKFPELDTKTPMLGPKSKSTKGVEFPKLYERTGLKLRDTDKDGVPDIKDHFPLDRSRASKPKKWIGKAVHEEREGRVRDYLRRKYGTRAFFKNGNIRDEYIDRAIREIKRRHPDGVPKGSDDYSLMMALHLAKRLDEY